MNILCILHYDEQKISVLEEWVKKNDCHLTYSWPYKQKKIQKFDYFDLIIVAGGTQNSIMMDENPFLYHEVDYIQYAIQSGKHVIGIGLGAQLISRALGSNPAPSPSIEIGCFPIKCTEFLLMDPLFKNWPAQIMAFHWHQDMASIPEGSIHLARSEGCPFQAYRYNDRVYAFQFHLELTLEEIIELIRLRLEDIHKKSKYIQSIEKMLKNDYMKMNHYFTSFLDRLLKKIVRTRKNVF